MRILYHHRTLGDGAEGIHIREMVAAFRDLGHEVRVVALVGEPALSVPEQTAARPRQRWSVFSRWLPGGAYEIAELGYNVVGKRAIARAIGEFRPDLIYDRYNSYSTAAVDVGNKTGIPVFLEVNAPVAYERTEYERRPLRFSRLATRIERRVFNAADHVFAVSTPLKEFLVSQRGVLDSRVTIVPNGANSIQFSPAQSVGPVRRELGIEAKKVIGFAGILRPWHGLDLLLDAFCSVLSHHPQTHLLIVGDGVIESALKQKAKDMGVLHSVTFTGRVPHERMNDYIAAMDIAVSPQATFYASPMKILEYMAMGIVTVAPDMPNIRDIVCNGENGVLFEAGDASSLASQLRKLLDSPAHARELADRGRRAVETDRNWTSIAQLIVQVANDMPRTSSG